MRGRCAELVVDECPAPFSGEVAIGESSFDLAYLARCGTVAECS